MKRTAKTLSFILSLALTGSALMQGNAYTASAEAGDAKTISVPGPYCLTGDLDDSYIVDITDLTMLSLYLLGDTELDSIQMIKADTDSNGSVTLSDLANFRQYLSRSPELSDSVSINRMQPSTLEAKLPEKSVQPNSLVSFAAKTAPLVLLEGDDSSGKENHVYSPASYHIAMSMAAECTRGITQKEILDALCSDTTEHLQDFYASFNEKAAKSSTFSSANSMWFNKKWEIHKDKAEFISEKYDAGIFDRDFSEEGLPKEISQWIYDNTNGSFMPEIKVDPIMDVLRIYNAIAFKGSWINEFSAGDTHSRKFTRADGSTVNCSFMTFDHDMKKETIGFAEKYMRYSLELNEGYLMNFILPDENVSLSDILSDNETMMDIYDNNHTYFGEYSMFFSVPKFDISSDYDLVEISNKMGISRAFDDTLSDFGEITPVEGVYIKAIHQEAKIKIDEKGCEAGAYTSVEAGLNSAPSLNTKVYFVLDRPFYYYISDSSGSPVFSGIIGNPAET